MTWAQHRTYDETFIGGLQWLSGEADASDAPPYPDRAAMYYNRLTGIWWEWDVETQAWLIEVTYRHYTESSYTSPALPFSFSAVTRTVMEIVYTLDPQNPDAASITVARSGGTPDIVLSATGALNDPTRHSSFHISPGDTVTITDTSAGASSATLDLVLLFEE
jgi:hypothetical protein